MPSRDRRRGTLLGLAGRELIERALAEIVG
jgi:hypothetical protein